jgi:hypothetical protein
MMPITIDDRRPLTFVPASVRKRRRGRHSIRLWLPLSLLWVVLIPLGVLVSPLLLILSLAGRGDIVRFVGAGVSLLAGLSGLQVEVDTPDALVFIRIL